MPMVEISMVKPPASEDNRPDVYRRRTIPIVVIPKGFQGVWEGWKAGFLAFHAFHTLVISMACFGNDSDNLSQHAGTPCCQRRNPRIGLHLARSSWRPQAVSSSETAVGFDCPGSLPPCPR